MARKSRLPYECYSCGTRFKSAQAVRGHRRHCRYPRLKRQAEAEAEAEPQPVTNARLGKRPGPLGLEAKLLLLEVQDEIERLQQTAGRFAGMAYELARMNVAGLEEKAQFWAQVYQEIDDCLRDLDPMLPIFQLNRGVMFRIYNTMRKLKERWLVQRIGACRFAETEPDGLDPETRKTLSEEEAHLIRIVDHLRRLVAAAP